MNYKNLRNNLIDLVKEEQAKLGYRKETIRLYYPLRSLQHILGTGMGAEELCEELQQYGAEDKSLGTLDISYSEERFCIRIPPEGVQWVHDQTEPAEFIVRLIALLADHGCTMEQVTALFRTQEKPIELQEMDHGEFDVMIRFLDGEDPYYYCFKDEQVHIIYHRFLPEDYRDFGF